MGGFGSAIAEFMISHNYQASITRLGIPDEFIEHGEQKELWNECNFDSEAIKRRFDKPSAKAFTPDFSPILSIIYPLKGQFVTI